MSIGSKLKQYSQPHSYTIKCLRAGVGADDNRVPIEVFLVVAPDNLDEDAREDIGNRSSSFAPTGKEDTFIIGSFHLKFPLLF